MQRKFVIVFIMFCLVTAACVKTETPVDIPDHTEDVFFTEGWTKAWQAKKVQWGLEGPALIKELDFALKGTELNKLNLVVLTEKEGGWHYYRLRAQRGEQSLEEQGIHKGHIDLQTLLDADKVFDELAAVPLEEWAYPGAELGQVDLVQKVEQGYIFRKDNDCSASLLKNGEKTMLADEEKIAVDRRHVLLRNYPVGNAESKKRAFLLVTHCGVVERYPGILPVTQAGDLLDFKWTDLDGDGVREEVLFLHDDKGYYLEIVTGRKVKRYTLKLHEAFMGAMMTLRDLTGNGNSEFIFEEYVGGSGGIVNLSVYRLVDGQMLNILRSKEYAQLNGIDNAYIGNNKVRVAVNSLKKVWQYELALSAYDTSDNIKDEEIRQQFAKQWVDSFSGYELLDIDGDGRIEILGSQIICGVAHADVVGKLKQVFKFNGDKYERQNLELYRFIPYGEERVAD